jgi:uric acid transporter
MSAATTELAPGEKPAKHPVDQVPPPGRLLILGLQHLFIMYAGAVAVPLIVGPAVGLDSSDIALLVSADLLVSGIASVLQSVSVGKIIGARPQPLIAGTCSS